MAIAEAPGKTEDEQGRPLVGAAGKTLRESLRSIGLDLDRDFVSTNIVQCRPPGNKWPGEDVRRRCEHRLSKQIEEFKPSLIFAFGEHAIRGVLDPPFDVASTRLRGRLIPSRKYNCWVSCQLHPSYVMRTGRDEVKEAFTEDLRRAAVAAQGGLPDFPNIDLKDPHPSPMLNSWKRALEWTWEAAIDFETTCLSPWDKGAELLCASFATEDEEYCIDCSDPDFTEPFREWLMNRGTTKIVHRLTFEQKWAYTHLNAPLRGRLEDTKMIAHVLDERRQTTGLAFQAFCLSGQAWKGMVDVKNMKSADTATMYEYCMRDARATFELYRHQRSVLGRDENKGLRLATAFSNRALPVLGRMQQRGLRVDMEEAERQQERLRLEQWASMCSLLRIPAVREWEMRTGQRFKPGSSDHVATMLEDAKVDMREMARTATGKLSVSAAELDKLREQVKGTEVAPVFDLISQHRKNDKVLGTYLKPILLSGGRLHPAFGLHTTETYRSSSDNPNMQNFPKRDDKAAVVRLCIVPSICAPDGEWLEGDIAGAELRVIAMLSKDRRLHRQIEDGVDVHRYWASVVYGIDEADVTKEQRFGAKQFFVFALFYGSWHESAARSLKLPIPQVKKAEARLWRDYKDVKAWQLGLIMDYKMTGYVEMPFGYRRHAPLDKRKIINTPVQGTSFHLLLEGLVEADRLLAEAGLKSKIVAEIHDSVLIDGLRSEREQVIEIVGGALARRKHAWQTLPMEIEWEAGPNWNAMEAL